jgi:ABC-type branched-subunit amino acid transport system permease subunit
MVSPEVEELKNHYELVLNLKATLESKANNMTTVAGVVATLLLGFGELFLSNLTAKNYQGVQYITFILLAGCLASLLAVLFSVLAWRIQNYYFVVGSQPIPKPSIAASVSSLNFDFALNDGKLINAYRDAIARNEGYNISKSDLIGLSQWFFFGSIVMISVLLIWLIISPP